MRIALLLFVWWLFAPAMIVLRKVYRAGATAGLLLLASATFAAAATAGDTSVSIPIGSWAMTVVDLLQELVMPIVVIVVGWAMRILPSAITAYLKMLQVDQLLARAIGWGLAAVREAAEGKVLTADVGNEVVASALQYAIDHAPMLVEWAGGSTAVREKLIARLQLDAGVSVVKDVYGVPSLS